MTRTDWYNNGRPWVNAPVLGYPLVWKIHIPTASNHYESIPVESLDEAIQRAAALGVPLEISDRTYELMVEEGFAPEERPAGIASGDNVVYEDGFDDPIVAYRKAKGLLGLPKAAALALAEERGLYVRAIGKRDIVFEDYKPSRANLEIERGIVTTIYVG